MAQQGAPPHIRLSSGPSNQQQYDEIELDSETVFQATTIANDGDLQRDEETDHTSKSLLEAVTSLKGDRVNKVREILEKGGRPNKRIGGKKRTPLHELLRRYEPDKPVDDDMVAEDLASKPVR